MRIVPDADMYLKCGDTGDLVKKLQKRLQITVDGVYGDQTIQSVKMWQERHDDKGKTVAVTGSGCLAVTGVVDRTTYYALFPDEKPCKEPEYVLNIDGKEVESTVFDSIILNRVFQAIRNAFIVMKECIKIEIKKK